MTMANRLRCAAAGMVLVGLSGTAAVAQSGGAASFAQSARAILQELIEINTTHSVGNTTVAAEALAKRFLAAGFPAADVQVVGPEQSKNHNLVVQYRGTGRLKPILLIAHLDVVEAKREDWSLDPFTLTERDGYFYGRGTSDQKGGAATLAAALLRLKREGFQPNRDIILALTAGEESGGNYNGVAWLLANRPDFKEIAFCLNVDSGEPLRRDGKVAIRQVQVAEKVSFNLMLEVTNPGGHSSLPTKENAIYRLARGLERLAEFDLPVHLGPITQAYFERAAQVESGPLAADMRAVACGTDARCTQTAAAATRLSTSPFYNALLRTTCVATTIEGGHAVNALPQRARANVNCRMLPFESPDSVEATVTRVVADTGVTVTRVTKPRLSPPSPLDRELFATIERVSASMWPDAVVVPYMETGGTDGIYLRNAGIPTYGVSGIALDVDDIRAHGRDERILVQMFYDGAEQVYRLVSAFAGGSR